MLKIFHFARFDIAVLEQYLGVVTAPIYCTKIASKLVRTYTDRHGLKDLVGELVGIELSKQQQSSDWGVARAIAAAAGLRGLRRAAPARPQGASSMPCWSARAARRFAQAAFGFLPTRAKLDLAGFGEDDIFSH